MAEKRTGVFPVYENQFQVNTGTKEAPTWTEITELESFSVSFDNGVEEWSPFEQKGWKRRLMGDTGNDAIAAIALKNGRDAEKDFQWTFPDGSKLVFKEAVINIKDFMSGDSTAAAPLSFDIMSNGKPEYTAAG